MEKEMAKVIHLWGTRNPLCTGDQFCMQVCVGFCTQPNAWFCMQILYGCIGLAIRHHGGISFPHTILKKYTNYKSNKTQTHTQNCIQNLQQSRTFKSGHPAVGSGPTVIPGSVLALASPLTERWRNGYNG